MSKYILSLTHSYYRLMQIKITKPLLQSNSSRIKKLIQPTISITILLIKLLQLLQIINLTPLKQIYLQLHQLLLNLILPPLPLSNKLQLLLTLMSADCAANAKLSTAQQPLTSCAANASRSLAEYHKLNNHRKYKKRS